MESRKSIFGTVASISLTAYLSVSLMFVFFYNINFIQQRGVKDWIFLGEVEPTVKGFFWPFFVKDTYNDLQRLVGEKPAKDPSTPQYPNNSGLRSKNFMDFAPSSKSRPKPRRTFRLSQIDYDFVNSLSDQKGKIGGELKSINLPLPKWVWSNDHNDWTKAIGSQMAGLELNSSEDNVKAIENSRGVNFFEPFMFSTGIDFYWVHMQNLEYPVSGGGVSGPQITSNAEPSQTYDYFSDSPILAAIAASQLNYPVPSENLKSFLRSLKNQDSKEIVVAKLRKIFDGSSFWVDIKGYSAVVGEYIGVRINNVDVPMLTDYRPEERAKAIQARDFVKRKLAEGERIVLKNVRPGQFYNIVADVYVDGNNLASELIEKGLGKPVND